MIVEDVNDIIGLNEEDAIDLLEATKTPWRVVEREGNRYTIILNRCMGRINLIIKGGKVEKAFRD